MKWYNEFIKLSKNKAETKKELKERIDTLKECSKMLKSALAETKSGHITGDHIKYTIGHLIPFNSIYRLIKYQDGYAGLSAIAEVITAPLGGGGSFIVRAITYEKMMEKAIKETDEAIEYLEEKYKEM